MPTSGTDLCKLRLSVVLTNRTLNIKVTHWEGVRSAHS